MTEPTTPALFRFQIPNSPDPIDLEHTHPVPTFLTIPAAAHSASSAYHAAYLDVISVVTAQHHAECMSRITTPCANNCGAAATDSLKSPLSFLHLAEPLVVVQISPVCGGRGCQEAVKGTVLGEMRAAERERVESEGRGYLGMGCAVCGREDAKRCKGCGRVAYWWVLNLPYLFPSILFCRLCIIETDQRDFPSVVVCLSCLVCLIRYPVFWIIDIMLN